MAATAYAKVNCTTGVLCSFSVVLQFAPQPNETVTVVVKPEPLGQQRVRFTDRVSFLPISDEVAANASEALSITSGVTLLCTALSSSLVNTCPRISNIIHTRAGWLEITAVSAYPRVHRSELERPAAGVFPNTSSRDVHRRAVLGRVLTAVAGPAGELRIAYVVPTSTGCLPP